MLNVLKKQFKRVSAVFSRLPTWLHSLFALLSFALIGVTNSVLEASYAASKYPVHYAVGQTAFSADKLKTYYAYMLEQDTLGLYWRTQFIDFAFIAAIFVAGIVVSLLFAQLHRDKPVLHKLSLLAAVLLPLGAGFDALENLTSFIMLAQPLTFSGWLALPYSGLAVLKFAAIGTGYCLWLVLIVALPVLWGFRRFKTVGPST